MKAVLGWVLFLLLAIGAGVGVEGATGGQGATPVSQAVPSLLVRELWNVSQSMATGQGDPTAALREAVGPVGRQLAEQVISDAGVEGDEPVYVIEVAGHFVCGECSAPARPGASPPTPSGTVITSTLDATTLFDTDFGISGRWVPLAALGKPFVLPKPPGSSLYWSIPTGLTVSSFTGQWSARGAQMNLAGMGETSTIVWSGGADYIDFRLNELRTGPHLPSEAAGGIFSDDVGIPTDSRVVLSAGAGGLSVTTTPAPNVALPEPFEQH